MRKLELLSPAKNLECGIAAIDHGADAVYIGAHSFSARAEAGNSLKDIEALISKAHVFGIKVYVALNTILFDSEFKQAIELIHQLHSIQADAIIIQDMGLLEVTLPPIALHASTQMNNRTVEKVRFLEGCGFEQVVLARELTVDQIAGIRRNTNVKLECFVHGSLCVSYSGNCYISQYVKGRSANRGNCAQFCRHRFSLTDVVGNKIDDGYLLSMKDLNLSDQIEKLIDAGVDSFKIEGRLKEAGYVKNITAYYRKKIDEIIESRSDLCRSSQGNIFIDFEPDPEKSFNRGYTTYFSESLRNKVAQTATSKSIGEEIGKISSVGRGSFIIETNKLLSNGDGVCFFNSKGELDGFNISKIEGNRIFSDLPIKPGTILYRNFDLKFTKLLDQSFDTRKIAVTILFIETQNGFDLKIEDEIHNSLSMSVTIEKQAANNATTVVEMVKNQLSKMGNTCFIVTKIDVKFETPFFIKAAVLNEARRDLTDRFVSIIREKNKPRDRNMNVAGSFSKTDLDFTDNIANTNAQLFYKKLEVEKIQPAMEVETPEGEVALMNTKYCIKFQIDACPFVKNSRKLQEPLFLEDNTGRYKLDFDCRKCEMYVKSLSKRL